MRSITLFLIAAFVTGVCSAQTVKVNECLIANGVLQLKMVDYDQKTGEKYITVDGIRKKFYDVYPKDGAGYAARLPWYINSTAISFNNLPYIKYGLPRILGTTELEKQGEYMGVNVYVESGYKGVPAVIYIPVRQGCEFQPYQLNCQQLYSIKGTDSVKAGKTVKLQALAQPGQSAMTNLNWEVSEGTIISGQGTATVKVAAKNVKDDKINVTLHYQTKIPCSSTQFTIYIKKP